MKAEQKQKIKKKKKYGLFDRFGEQTHFNISFIDSMTTASKRDEMILFYFISKNLINFGFVK